MKRVDLTTAVLAAWRRLEMMGTAPYPASDLAEAVLSVRQKIYLSSDLNVICPVQTSREKYFA